MATKNWKIVTDGYKDGVTAWEKLYKKRVLANLTPRGQRYHTREREIYAKMEFDFDPVVQLDAALFDQIKNDSVFLGNGFRVYKPIIDKMVVRIVETIKKYARAKMHRSHREKIKYVKDKLLWELIKAEGDLINAAHKELEKRSRLQRDVQKYKRGKHVSRAKIGIKTTAAVAGAVLATASAIATPGPGTVAACFAWYGVARNIAGSVQELRNLSQSTRSAFLGAIQHLETLQKTNYRKWKGAGTGAAKALTGMQVAKTIRPFEDKLSHLKKRLKSLQWKEVEVGQQINEALENIKDLRPRGPSDLPFSELDEAMEAILDLHMGRRPGAPKRKPGQPRTPWEERSKRPWGQVEVSSHKLQIWLDFTQRELATLSRKHKNARRIEVVIDSILSLGLSTGSAAVCVVAGGGITFSSELAKDVCRSSDAIRKAQNAAISGKLDTVGLIIGGLSDVHDIDGARQELFA